MNPPDGVHLSRWAEVRHIREPGAACWAGRIDRHQRLMLNYDEEAVPIPLCAGENAPAAQPVMHPTNVWPGEWIVAAGNQRWAVPASVFAATYREV